MNPQTPSTRWTKASRSFRRVGCTASRATLGGMGELIYVTNVSLDFYIEDKDGSFNFSTAEDDFFAFITDVMRPLGTHLYGRRLYETMAVWGPTPPWPPNPH